MFVAFLVDGHNVGISPVLGYLSCVQTLLVDLPAVLELGSLDGLLKIRSYGFLGLSLSISLKIPGVAIVMASLQG